MSYFHVSTSAALFRTVTCTANRGKSYVVRFEPDGVVRQVFCTVRGPNGMYRRSIYQNNMVKPMSIIAACAVRAALAGLKEHHAITFEANPV